MNTRVTGGLSWSGVVRSVAGMECVWRVVGLLMVVLAWGSAIGLNYDISWARALATRRSVMLAALHMEGMMWQQGMSGSSGRWMAWRPEPEPVRW